jgi:ATP-dependent 26S proteasome regulatory subunit
MADDKNYIYDTFLIYYDNAKKAQECGNFESAKRNLLLAAEALFKLAKLDTGELKKSRFERANRLLEIANNMDTTPKNKNTNNGNGVNSKDANQQKNNEDAGKKFVAGQIPDIHFSDVAGLHDVKRAITIRMINPIKYKDKYEAYGKKTGGGVLLYGPPGTGKTMIAKAIACEVGATFYAIKGSDIVSKWVGESEQNINALFETARKDPLAIIFIDEMDSLFGKRGVDTHNDKRVNEFLQQIDGFAGKNPNLLLLGATNRPWDVDGAAVRSGRFSEKIYVPLPDYDARKYLIEKNIKKIPVGPDVDVDLITKLTEGYSGADIDEICDLAKEEPLMKYINSDSIIPVSMADFKKAIRHVRPTTTKKEIKEFEDYAGLNKSFVEETNEGNDFDFDVDFKEEKNVEPAKPAEKPVEITFLEENIFLLPNQLPNLEFHISENFDYVSIVVDGNNYVCNKRLSNWVSEKINITKSGTYDVVIKSGERVIGTRKISFNEGFSDNDLGI